MLWHLLSLDAPTVAAVWLIFVAQANHVFIPPSLPAVMFLVVWLIYACDRLLDTRHLPPTSPTPADSLHQFHHAHRFAFSLVASAACVLILLLLPTIPAVLLAPYLLLAVCLFAWFCLIHFTSISLPKPLAPGAFFAAAVFLPALTHQLARALIVPALCFSGLCTLNCLLIRFWERHSYAPLNLRLFVLALALTALPLSVSSPVSHAVSLSALALLLLARFRLRLHPATLRAAADLTLLTPILLLTSLKWG